MSLGTVGLENRGVSYGVHDFQSKPRSREEYQQLLLAAGDTRNRIHNVTQDHGGTFHAKSRAQSYGAPGHHPRNEYADSRLQPQGDSHTETAHPKKVMGGFGFSYQGNSRGLETRRKFGSLERNVIGNCSVVDDRHVYYGHSSHHYGGNSGTQNQGHWKPKKKA